jgi:hypothetical protein
MDLKSAASSLDFAAALRILAIVDFGTSPWSGFRSVPLANNVTILFASQSLAREKAITVGWSASIH